MIVSNGWRCQGQHARWRFGLLVDCVAPLARLRAGVCPFECPFAEGLLGDFATRVGPTRGSNSRPGDNEPPRGVAVGCEPVT